MRNSEGGAAACTHSLNVQSTSPSLLQFFFLFLGKGGEAKGGECGPEPDNLEDVVA